MRRRAGLGATVGRPVVVTIKVTCYTYYYGDTQKRPRSAPQTRCSRCGGADARGARAQAARGLSLASGLGQCRTPGVLRSPAPRCQEPCDALPRRQKTSGESGTHRPGPQYACALESASGRTRAIILSRVGAHPRGEPGGNRRLSGKHARRRNAASAILSFYESPDVRRAREDH